MFNMTSPTRVDGSLTATSAANAAALVSDQRESAGSDHARPGSGGTICDLADGHAFCPDSNSPPIPVLTAFGGGRLHQCRAEGSWDLGRAIADEAIALVRSYRRVRLKDNFREWDDLTFQFGPQTFLCADDRRIVAYAATAAEAERQVEEFTQKYGLPPKSSGGSFQLIYVSEHDIGTVTVQLEANTILSEENLGLYYGDRFAEWHRDFARKLEKPASCLSIFEGAPGTGKTSYLRHLIGVLQETHRFYFIPPATMRVLSDPRFMEFWAEQRRFYPHRKLAVILEDSDAALMTRASDNTEQVSAILNLSDGMLGDFLRLQMICTINCTTSDIDAALLRPGRLLCHRVFPRLNPAEARRLAETLGRTLPTARDYSLAEVFAGPPVHEASHPQIGFAA
jgi:hypothetical protein